MGASPEVTEIKSEVVRTEPSQSKGPDLRSTIDLIQVIESTSLRETYAREAIENDAARQRFAQDWRLARVFAESGIFDDIKGKTPEQAVAMAMTKIELGRSWGIGPADSMRFIYFANGKPSIETELIASKLQEAGYSWDVEWVMGANNICAGCRLWLKKWNKEAGFFEPMTDSKKSERISVEFTKTDSDNAMIWEGQKQIKMSDKWNYKSWPREMYFARCISRIKKWHAPNILRGAMTREEAEELPSAPAPVIPDKTSDQITPLLSELEGVGVSRRDVTIKLRHDPAMCAEEELGFLRSAITAIKADGKKWADLKFGQSETAKPAEPEKPTEKSEAEPTHRGRKPKNAEQPAMFQDAEKSGEPEAETIANTPFASLFQEILTNNGWVDAAEVDKVLMKEWNIKGIAGIPKGDPFVAICGYFKSNKPKGKKA